MSGGLAGLRAPGKGAFVDPGAWRDLLQSDDPATFSQAWLRLVVASIDQALTVTEGSHVVLGGFVALRTGEGLRYTRTATYGGGEVSFLLAKAAERCLQLRRAVGQSGGGNGAVDMPADLPSQIAVPVMVGNELEGVVALEVASHAESQLDRATRLAQWGTAWFSRIIGNRDAQADRGHADMVLKAIALAASEGSLASVGQALCTFLADQLGLVRVSLGVAAIGPQKAVATSRGGLATVKTDFIVALAATLDEAAAAAVPLLWPVPDEQMAAIGAHGRLCRSHNADWAASFPVEIDRITLVLCCEGQGAPPATATRTAWGELVRLLAPLLALRFEAQQSLAVHAGLAARHALRDWTVDAPRARWVMLGLAVAAALYLGFANGDYRVAARATLEGEQKRAIVVPFDGYLAEARLRPGERVKAGDVLARLDDRDLRLQRLNFQARIAEAQHQVTDAVGRREMAAAAIATARRQQFEAELKLVDENLSRAIMVAPFDALVIAGDPTQQIGAPLRHGEQLYELSPLERFRVAVDVEQSDFADIAPGQTGRLVLSSLPYDFWPVEVVRITPIASARDGQTSFRVEADLKTPTEELHARARTELRPGMQGIVKIDAGERRHIWIWTHAMLAWARLKLWEWIP